MQNNNSENLLATTEIQSEVIVEDKVKNSEIEVPTNVPEEPSVEERARQQGWRPKTEFYGHVDDWVDAPEFIRRGSLFKRIESQNKTIDELKSMLNNTIHTLSKAEERAYRRAIEEINSQKAVARENNDIVAYEQVIKKEQQLHDQFVTNQQAQVSITPTNSELSPDIQKVIETDYFKSFKAQNPWLEKTDKNSRAVQVYATELANELEKENPGASPESILSKVHEEIRQAFPNVFNTNDAQRSRAAVTSSTVRSTTSNKSSTELTPAQQQMIDYIKSTGGGDKEVKAYLNVVKLASENKDPHAPIPLNLNSRNKREK